MTKQSQTKSNLYPEPTEKTKTVLVSMCDIVIYSKKYIFVLPVLATESLNPWNFLSGDNIKSVLCFANEMIFGKHQWIGAGCQGNQPRLEGWNFHPLISGDGKDGRLNQ